MLELRNISKEYRTGAETVHALRSIDLAFRRSEFVSILGPSGCGKTTMLNILGGLDQYTSGDLVIDGISTREYKDADWDAYRNDTIGFVFQSYNLISHQTVLANVELALTLSGVSPAERKRRAISALEQVGLGDQLNKKPAQMSGGQVQRVAIARALINDPDIILADEPTGALDSETSMQVMSILKEISARKLVIMVTHNPELAAEYSTRIVRLSDGRVISDSNPYLPGVHDAAAGGIKSPAALSSGSTEDLYSAGPGAADEILAEGRQADNVGSRRARRRRNRSMSMITALSLSLNNLMTKKARTLLTAFAGSIGIIGIALILSVSNGFQTYIDKLEEDTLSSYPLTIQSETADITSMITAFAAGEESKKDASGDGLLHEQQVMADMLGSIGSNDLAAFKKHIDSHIGTIGEWFNDYEYTYGISPTIYSLDMKYGPLRVSPGSIMQSYMNSMQSSMISYANTDVFFQMIENQDLLKSQYRVLAGKWPDEYNELLLVLQDEDQLNDYIAYTLGLRDPAELKDMINEVMKGKEVSVSNEPLEWTYDDFVGMEFALVNPSDMYRRNSEYKVWEDMSDDDDYVKDLIDKSERLHISGIVCPIEKSGANAMSMGIGYLPDLTRHMIDYAAGTDIVKIQLADKDTDVFSGKTFEDIRNKTDDGLGFDDMIGIDQDKLASAFGGGDTSKLEAEIRKTGDAELAALTGADSAEKIESDVTEAVRSGCEGMNSYVIDKLIKQAEKDPSSLKIDEVMVSKALSQNLDTGKHKAIVNAFLKAYAEVLKSSGDKIISSVMSAMSSGYGGSGSADSAGGSAGGSSDDGTDGSSGDESGDSSDAADGSNSAASGAENPSDSEDTYGDTASGSASESSGSAASGAETVAGIIREQTGCELSDQQVSMLLQAASLSPVTAEMILGATAQTGQSINKEHAEQIASIINQAASGGSDASGGDSSGGSGSRSSSDITAVLRSALETAFSGVTDGMLSADETANGIRQYADGIEMMQFAGEVYPALGKVAQAVGSQFNIDPSAIAEAFSMKMSEDDLTRLITAYMSGNDESSLEANLRKLGYANLDNPVQISFYLKDFDSKEKLLDFIDGYNKDMQDAGEEDLVISYTDITGVMMKSVKTITNAVSYVLIAFVAISLIVSSIMIGVITYISVLERTKEIGILRAIGASKRDISRIFNAETIIVGLCAGLIGIGASLLLLIPINRILIGLTGLQSLKAILPAAGGVILILISIFLTFIAGLIPSGMAARKDPVVALRTE